MRGKDVAKGIGDDAAVLEEEGSDYRLVSKDLLLQDIHFDLTYFPLSHLGYKAISTNVSDILAMNGRPGHALIGLGISNNFSVENVEEIYSGINKACQEYDMEVIGGDTCSSKTGLMISVTVLGKVGKKDVCYRDTAKSGDILLVSGDLGAPLLGLHALEREKEVFRADPHMQPKLEDYKYVVERFLFPQARIDVVEALKEKGVRPTSMIDISDGLSSEVLHLCRGAGLGVTVFEKNLPVDANTMRISKEFNLSPYNCALHGGEEYQLLMTVGSERPREGF